MARDLVAGLVLNYKFHQDDGWVATICTPSLVDSMIERFNCIIINNQEEFKRYYKEVDFMISMEPGWAAPILDYRRLLFGIPTRTPKLSYIFYSDPHIEQWREDYFLNNKLSFILAFYYKPTLHSLQMCWHDHLNDVWLKSFRC